MTTSFFTTYIAIRLLNSEMKKSAGCPYRSAMSESNFHIDVKTKTGFLLSMSHMRRLIQQSMPAGMAAKKATTLSCDLTGLKRK